MIIREDAVKRTGDVRREYTEASDAALVVSIGRYQQAALAEALELEVEGVGRLVGTPAMKSLVNLFFRMEEVKKETGVAAGVAALPVKRIGVLGAGAMGGGIAQLAADKGRNLPAGLAPARLDGLMTIKGVIEAQTPSLAPEALVCER